MLTVAANVVDCSENRIQRKAQLIYVYRMASAFNFHWKYLDLLGSYSELKFLGDVLEDYKELMKKLNKSEVFILALKMWGIERSPSKWSTNVDISSFILLSRQCCKNNTRCILFIIWYFNFLEGSIHTFEVKLWSLQLWTQFFSFLYAIAKITWLHIRSSRYDSFHSLVHTWPLPIGAFQDNKTQHGNETTEQNRATTTLTIPTGRRHNYWTIFAFSRPDWI